MSRVEQVIDALLDDAQSPSDDLTDVEWGRWVLSLVNKPEKQPDESAVVLMVFVTV